MWGLNAEFNQRLVYGMYYFQERPRTLSQQPTTSPADPPTALEDCSKLCRCRVRLRALYLALGLKPIVQIVTVSPSTLLVKFVGALLNLLLNRAQDGRPVVGASVDGSFSISSGWRSALLPSCSVCRCNLSALVRFSAMHIACHKPDAKARFYTAPLHQVHCSRHFFCTSLRIPSTSLAPFS